MAKGEDAPTKYWLSTLASDISVHELVDITKLRWRIKRDYHELKQEIGLGHFEGPGWRGFHRHATLCIAAYGFLIFERETVPPFGAGPHPVLPTICRFHRVIDPEAPPLRTEHYIPNS